MATEEAEIDYRGARGSNTGDQFHELWAVRQAMRLLDEGGGLTAVTVEGLGAAEGSSSVWDGVDCGLFFEGDSAASAERVEVQQLKYSAADPDKPWTVARIATGRLKRVRTSPIGRLADAYSALKTLRPGKAISSLRIAFVSNQPISEDLIAELEKAQQSVPSAYRKAWKSGDPDLHRLVHASGLSPTEFNSFASVLDLQGSTGSRFAVEDDMLKTVSQWSEGEFSEAARRLREFIRKRMLPEAARERITRERILLQFGVSDERALFPCPSAITKVTGGVSRVIAQMLVDRMMAASQRVCLHGTGGVGKTTILQEVESLLPAGSKMIVFDCYGGGSYIDASAYRHRPAEAFIQLSNELARRLRLPLVLERRNDSDHARAFHRRLEIAASALASAQPTALVVLAIDAADSSVTAASTRNPPEPSFIHDLMSFQSLPGNVRLVVSARTGRLSELRPPSSFEQIPLPAFTATETALNVARHWDAPPEWIDDFHHLSEGVPRVQSYAFDNAGRTPPLAIDALRPLGKKLDQIFRDRFTAAFQKVGRTDELERVCAGLIALARPIPIVELAAVLDMPAPLIIDICADLSPGVRNRDGFLSFADEDFEAFVREAAHTAIPEIVEGAATRFLARCATNAYAALNVAPALLAAGRSTDLLDLVEATPEPAAELIPDPVVRHEIRLQRVRLAIRVCREAEDTSRALRFVLIGAEAINTEAETRALLAANPGLTARYARDTASRLILGDSSLIEEHGPLLLQLLAEDAARGDAIAVREGRRRFRAWWQAREDAFESQRQKFNDAHAWDIFPEDGAASLYATLLMEGEVRAVEHHLSFRPVEFSVRASRALIERLVSEGRLELLERLAAKVGDLRAIFLLVPIAMAGKQIDLDRLASGLMALKRRVALDETALRESYQEDAIRPFLVDTALCAAEILTARGGPLDVVRSVLAPFLDSEVRRIDKRHDFEASLLDAILRSYSLSEALDGRVAQSADILTPRPVEAEDAAARRGASSDARQHDDSLRELISALSGVYATRAQLLVGRSADKTAATALDEGQRRFHSDSWRFDRRHTSHAMRARMAENLTVLLAAGADPDDVMTRALSFHRGRWPQTGSGVAGLFKRLAGLPSLHQRLVTEIVQAAVSTRLQRSGAQDKSRTLAAYARLLAPISSAEADAIFEQAIEVASELDSEAMDQLRLIERLVGRSGSTFGDTRRGNALLLSEILHDAAIRLEHVEHFPWEAAMSALAQLDLPIALGCVSRWDDAQIVGLSQSLQPILDVGLDNGQLTAAHGASLAALLERPPADAITHLLEKTEQDGGARAEQLAEEFAHDAMVDRLTGSSSIAAFITRHGKGYWTEQFSAQQKFVSALLPLGGSDKDRTKNGYQEKPRPVLEAFVWQESLLINGDALAQSAQKLLEDCRVAGETLSLGDILARARSGVPVGRRIDHLNALLLAHELDPDWQFLDAILSAVDVWSPSPAVSSWCDQKLPRLISENLPDFARSLPWQDRTLAAALAKANLSDEQIQAILLRGIESNTDHLSAAITFALAGEIGTKLTPKAAADLCAWYLERLAKRIPPDERENMPPDTLASSMSEALARLFYAYLGDVDVRVRWRTAHALRRLARLGQTDILMAVASQYDRMTDGSFRNPKAPYYWIASRMWLVIALDRIAHETPSAIASLAPVLLKVALDHEFPHLLIRAYAADACRKLVSAGLVELTPDQQSELAKVNVSTLPAGNREREYGGGFDRFDRRDEPTRRFHFDGLDTLRYWYAPWLRAFDDLTPDALLEVAESWIVDKWGVQDEKPYGSKEPRARRFSERAWALSSTSHGSLPTLERYKSHLEWHAMWCAAGQLLDTHRVKPPDYDDASDNELQYQISQEKLTQPPIWLADLVGPRPLEEQRWRAPDPSDPDCFNSVADDVFLAELFPADRPGYVVVDAHTELRHGKFRESTRVQSGVVSPETAHSLVRALQTVEDASDFYICPEDHELEIDDTEFKLLGWLRSPDGDSGLDKQDVFRNGVSRMQAMPGRLATERLRLTLAYSQPVCWLRPGDTEPAFIYEAWGEREREDDRGYYDERIVSSGYRLLVRKTDLAELLASEGFDLITEVGVKRREQGGGRYAYDAQDAQEAEFDRILLLLRQAGEIAAAERSLGAWRPIGS